MSSLRTKCQPARSLECPSVVYGTMEHGPNDMFICDSQEGKKKQKLKSQLRRHTNVFQTAMGWAFRVNT